MLSSKKLLGSIPSELVKEAKGGEVHVDMEDHRYDILKECIYLYINLACLSVCLSVCIQ